MLDLPRDATPTGLAPVTRSGRPCRQGEGDEIVVCGRRDSAERYRIPPPEPPNATLPRAEIGILGEVRASAELEQEQVLPGMMSRRIMLRFKVPF